MINARRLSFKKRIYRKTFYLPKVIKVYFKSIYKVSGNLESKGNAEKFLFNIPLDEDEIAKVYLYPIKQSLEAYYDCEISNDLFGYIQAGEKNSENLPLQLQYELNQIDSKLSKAARKVIEPIKYVFYQIAINDELVAHYKSFWSIDCDLWQELPQEFKAAFDVHNLIFVNDDNVKLVQQYIYDEKFEPLIALRHLHRAKREHNSRYKWIEATIAAELAIKEFLVRFKPELETLLLELPSPPLHKLYGDVLESIAEERSPKTKELQKGTETRNKLIHKPMNQIPDDQKTFKYVLDVEAAIYHLLTLLYPNDQFLENMYKAAIFLSSHHQIKGC